MNKYDCIIIGGGIIGCSVAYYASKLGQRVLVIEKEDHAKGSAGATDGVVGYHTKKPGHQMELAVQSISLFPGLSDELGEDIEFEENCGGMQVAEDKMQWDILSQIAEEQRASGVDIQMIPIEDAIQLEPYLSPDLYGALYSPTSGKVNPIKLTFAFSKAAKRLGAKILTETVAKGILLENGRTVGVETNCGRFYADKIVNACGAHAASIGKMVGLDIPILPRKGQLIVTEPIGSFMNCTLQCALYNVIKFRPEAVTDERILRTGSSLSIKQTKSGGLIIGSTREMAGYDKENTLEAIEAILKRAIKFFPALKNVSIIRAFAGLRPYTPDGMPMIGEVLKVPGFYMAAGHEGDGIALSPITGKLLAEEIAYGKSSFSLEPFTPNRFL